MLMKFFRDRRGSVLPMFAIAAVPMIVATGAVVDYNRAYDQSTVVQDAMDGAALAAGKKLGIWTDTQIKAEAQAFYNANVATKIDIQPTIDPVISAATLTITSELHVPTYFLGMIGLNEFVFRLKSQTTQAMGTLEVVMALDNSGSMAGTKISTLITAAKDLTDTLYGLAGTSTKPDPVMVGLAPFAASVKVDPTAAKAASPAWLDTTGVAPYNAESFEGSTGSPPVSNNTPSGKNVLDMYNTLSGTGAAWAGCLEERQAPYDVQDDPANTGTPATMFVPMFAPDEPDNWTCTTGTCSKTCDSGSCTSASAGLRYNGAPTGTQTHNNYLADDAPATCGNTVTMTSAAPAVFTRTGHGLTAGKEIAFSTTGTLYTGLTAGAPYKVLASGLTTNTFQVAPSPGAAVTMTIAAPGVFTSSSHGLAAGDVVEFQTTGALPTGLVASTPYYVISAGLTSNTFEVSAIYKPVTLTIATPAPSVFTSTGHGLTAGTGIQLSTTGALPTGLTAGTTYYVIAAGLTANTFMLAPQSRNVTMTIANPAVFTNTSHGMAAGTPIIFQTTGSLPTGVTAGTTYYVAAAGLTANTFKVSPASGSTTVTMTKSSPAVFTTSSSHGLTVNTAIVFSTTGALYTGLTAGTTYYVKTVPLVNTFTVSATVGGAAINTSGSQSGTQSYVRLVTTTGSQSGTHSYVQPIVTSGSQSGTHAIVQALATSGSQSGTHTFLRPVSTSGSQSGIHSYTMTADWTCANGAAGCGTGSVGQSEQTALLGQNVASQNICKYGTVANKAAIASFNVQTNGGTYPSGPNFNCTTDAVVPLSNDKNVVKTAIGNMAADGTTNITAGLMWGWRMLSPGAPYTEGRAYNVGDNKKILILMTDGENTYFANGKFTVSHYGAWGYIWKSHLGTTSSTESVMTGKMEGRMETACANIKSAGIDVFTVAFEITDATTKQLLKDCSSDPATMAFDAADPAALTAAFSAIGEQISLLRLAL